MMAELLFWSFEGSNTDERQPIELYRELFGTSSSGECYHVGMEAPEFSDASFPMELLFIGNMIGTIGVAAIHKWHRNLEAL